MMRSKPKANSTCTCVWSKSSFATLGWRRSASNVACAMAQLRSAMFGRADGPRRGPPPEDAVNDLGDELCPIGEVAVEGGRPGIETMGQELRNLQ